MTQKQFIVNFVFTVVYFSTILFIVGTENTTMQERAIIGVFYFVIFMFSNIVMWSEKYGEEETKNK